MCYEKSASVSPRLIAAVSTELPVILEKNANLKKNSNRGRLDISFRMNQTSVPWCPTRSHSQLQQLQRTCRENFAKNRSQKCSPQKARRSFLECRYPSFEQNCFGPLLLHRGIQPCSRCSQHAHTEG